MIRRWLDFEDMQQVAMALLFLSVVLVAVIVGITNVLQREPAPIVAPDPCEQLQTVLANYGDVESSSSRGDMNGDGHIDLQDVSMAASKADAAGCQTVATY